MKRERATALVEEMLRRLDQDTGRPLELVDAVYLFGSYARGALEPHDVDIAVDFHRDEEMAARLVSMIEEFEGLDRCIPRPVRYDLIHWRDASTGSGAATGRSPAVLQRATIGWRFRTRREPARWMLFSSLRVRGEPCRPLQPADQARRQRLMENVS
uniref:Nucleotidyltransferase domain-containing protein n=1 Tax=Streptomyces sp. NBC_00003 TaxID=2903608 RepID=A0AAU2UZP1_9ACTN